MIRVLLFSLLIFIPFNRAQEFRFQRPVPDTIQTNGSYLYGEPSVHGGNSAHNGTDISIRYDTVYSASDGYVTFVGYNPQDTIGGYEPTGAGNYIIVRTQWNGSFYYLLYMHLTRPFIFAGQTISQGQPIALSGNTGFSTGPHLHFEIRKGSQSSGSRNKRNAELWCAMEGMGAIYGRIPNAPNSTRVDIFPDPKPRPPYTTFSYALTYLFADPYIGSDDIYNENYAIGDVKPGTYTIRAMNNTYVRTVTVGPGEVVNADPPTGIPGQTALVEDYSLSQNYPNPFNPTTVVSFQIPERSFVSLKIFDMIGREVSTLVNEVRGSGYYNEFFDAYGLPSGAYVYVFTAQSFESDETFREAKKMMLLK